MIGKIFRTAADILTFPVRKPLTTIALASLGIVAYGALTGATAFQLTATTARLVIKGISTAFAGGMAAWQFTKDTYDKVGGGIALAVRVPRLVSSCEDDMSRIARAKVREW